MAVLRVKRPSPGKRDLLFQGRWLTVGASIDTAEFPRVSKIPGKWAQLVRLGIFHDDHLEDPELVRELESQRAQFGASEMVIDTRPEPVAQIDRYLTQRDRAEVAAVLDKPVALTCGECGYHAKSRQGLKVHVGRSHKKE